MSKIKADWPRFSKPLTSFNRMVVARRGNIPVKIVLLAHGTDADLKTILQLESQFLYENNLIAESEYFDSLDTVPGDGSHMIYLQTIAEDMKLSEDNFYFTTETILSAITVAAENAAQYEPYDYSNFIKELGLEGLTAEVIESYEHEIQLRHEVRFNMKEAINETLLNHYATTEDRAFNVADFDWVLQAGSKRKSKEMYMSAVLSKKNSTAIRTGKVTADNKEADNSDDKKGENISPAPSKKKTIDFVKKMELTKEEKAINDSKLETLIKAHEDAIKVVRDSHNAEWSRLIDKMVKAVEERDFKPRWCKMYLDDSDDTSSEIYQALYDLDTLTMETLKTITHQVLKLGCWSCNHEWEEDITFKDYGAHFTECPKCHLQRGYDKSE